MRPIALLAFVGGILLAFLLAAGLPGGLAPVLLATALPAVLLMSARLRRASALAFWTLATIPTALSLWYLAATDGLPFHGALFVPSAVSLLLFVRTGSPARPSLLLLGGLVLFVAYLSSGHGSGLSMEAWFQAHGLSKATADAATLAFRKTVHFTFYGTVGWSGFRAVVAAPSGASNEFKSHPCPSPEGGESDSVPPASVNVNSPFRRGGRGGGSQRGAEGPTSAVLPSSSLLSRRHRPNSVERGGKRVTALGEAVRTGLLVALAVAAFDELRQAGYSNRTGSAYDVLLDLSGAAVFVGLSAWRAHRAPKTR